jgi:hypothetical protein
MQGGLVVVWNLMPIGARQTAAAIVLAICLGGPTIELFDHWDSPVDGGSDTELSAVIVALCVGVALAAAGAIVAQLGLKASIAPAALMACSVVRSVRRLSAIAVPCGRPPTPLRI